MSIRYTCVLWCEFEGVSCSVYILLYSSHSYHYFSRVQVHSTIIKITLFCVFRILKGTISVISSDPSCKDDNACLITDHFFTYYILSLLKWIALLYCRKTSRNYQKYTLLSDNIINIFDQRKVWRTLLRIGHCYFYKEGQGRLKFCSHSLKICVLISSSWFLRLYLKFVCITACILHADLSVLSLSQQAMTFDHNLTN